MKITVALLSAVLLAGLATPAGADGRKGSHLVGGHGSHGRGGHYVGGHRPGALHRLLHRL